MKTFEYLRPASLDELLSVMSEHGGQAKLLAGGTDLVVRIRKRRDVPPIVVDLKHVRELGTGVTRIDRAIRIGARAVMSDIIANPEVRRSFPALAEAAQVVGSVQIRNRATLAGNICNASPAADTALPLLAYGAVANLISTHGKRRVAVDHFFTGPGRTTLSTSEIVESIDLPLPDAATGSAFGRLTRRHGVDLAIVSVSCAVSQGGETALAFGAVGPRPLLVRTHSAGLIDTHTDLPERQAMLGALLAQASPRTDLRGSSEYRRAMLGVLTERTLQVAIHRLRTADRG